MCANYLPTRPERLAEYFRVTPPAKTYSSETYPGGMAPIIRPAHSKQSDDHDALECVMACFGLLPHWAKPALARQTYNARSETIASKPSYRHAWKQGQFCLVPADAFCEPSYENSRPVRWKVADPAGQPLAIAGIWDWRPDGGPDGGPLVSFSMVTIAAGNDPLMKRFHKPDDEKRSVVLLEPSQFDEWLHTTPADAPKFLTRFSARPMAADPWPRPAAVRPPVPKPVAR